MTISSATPTTSAIWSGVYYDATSSPPSKPHRRFLRTRTRRYLYLRQPGPGDRDHQWHELLLAHCPYRKSARVTITTKATSMQAPSIITSIGGQLKRFPRDAGYFHAQYRQAFPCPDRKALPHLDTEGAPGQYMGVSLSVHTQVEGWWGEGDDMITSTAKKSPIPVANGVRRLFQRRMVLRRHLSHMRISACLSQRQDQAPTITGSLPIPPRKPIAFQRSIKVEIEHGANGVTTPAAATQQRLFVHLYWYMKKPVARKGALPAGAERISKLRRVGQSARNHRGPSGDRETPPPGSGSECRACPIARQWLNFEQLFCERNTTGSLVGSR